MNPDPSETIKRELAGLLASLQAISDLRDRLQEAWSEVIELYDLSASE